MGCIVAPAVPAPVDAGLTITIAREKALDIGDFVTHSANRPAQLSSNLRLTQPREPNPRGRRHVERCSLNSAAGETRFVPGR
jgi:hypothetical protein